MGFEDLEGVAIAIRPGGIRAEFPLHLIRQPVPVGIGQHRKRPEVGNGPKRRLNFCAGYCSGFILPLPFSLKGGSIACKNQAEC